MSKTTINIVWSFICFSSSFWFADPRLSSTRYAVLSLGRIRIFICFVSCDHCPKEIWPFFSLNSISDILNSFGLPLDLESKLSKPPRRTATHVYALIQNRLHIAFANAQLFGHHSLRYSRGGRQTILHPRNGIIHTRTVRTAFFEIVPGGFPSFLKSLHPLVNNSTLHSGLLTYEFLTNLFRVSKDIWRYFAAALLDRIPFRPYCQYA